MGRQASGVLSSRPLRTGILQAAQQCCDNGSDDIVLDSKEVLWLADIALCPQLTAGLCLRQPHRHAHFVGGPCHRSVEHVVHSELTPNLGRIGGLAT